LVSLITKRDAALRSIARQDEIYRFLLFGVVVCLQGFQPSSHRDMMDVLDFPKLDRFKVEHKLAVQYTAQLNYYTLIITSS